MKVCATERGLETETSDMHTSPPYTSWNMSSSGALLGTSNYILDREDSINWNFKLDGKFTT